MDIGRKLAELEARLARVEASPRLSHAAIDNTSVEVRDSSGGLRGLLGVQADGTTAVNIVNGPPPPQPTVPLLTSVLGGITASWDGLFDGGAALPLDWQRIEVHASTTDGFTPAPETLHGTIETPQGLTVVVSTSEPVYVRLLARSTSGTPSTPSGQAGPLGPAQVVADDILDGIVTTVKLADEAVTAAKVRVGAIGADQLALGIGNLAPDPSFEGAYTEQLVEDAPDWTIVTPGNNSPKALHVDCTAGAVTWKNLVLGRYPVLSGERHFLAVDYQLSASFDGTGAKLMLRYEDAAGGVTGWGVADKPPVPGGGWERATAQVQAPAGTVTAVLMVEVSEVTAGEAWFDNAEVHTLVVGGMIAAGAVTANEIAAGSIETAHLVAEAVQAGNIAAGAVTTAKLDALAVTADQIAANAIVAGKIAAGAVTATSLTVGVAQSIAAKILDAMGDASLWTQTFDSGTWQVLSGVTDAAAGGTVAEAAGPVTLERVTNTPYDPDVLYKVTVRVRTLTAPTSGTPALFMGLVGVAADGVTRVTSTGTNNVVTGHHYVAANDVTVAVGTTWSTFTGYVKGHAATGTTEARPDPKMSGQMHTNVRYVRPIIRLLRNATGGTMQVDQVTLETVPTGVVNAVNIADGAVTAASLAADAITGKTITGGTITGSYIQTATSGQRITLNEADANKILVYNSSGAAIGELSAQGLLVKGTGGAVLHLDPNNTYPNLKMTNAGLTNAAIINVVETTTGAADLGLNTGTFTANGFTDMTWRMFMGNDFAVIERYSKGNPTINIGGRLDLRNDHAVLGYYDETGTTRRADLVITPGVVKARARAIIQADAGDSNSLLLLQPGPSHTGYIVRYWDPDASTYRFSIDKSGNTDVNGILTAGNIAAGRLTITPNPNVPTSQNVTGLSLKGTSIRVVATAATSVPGTQVTGVGVTSQSATGFTVWVTRTNNTATVIEWHAYGV